MKSPWCFLATVVLATVPLHGSRAQSAAPSTVPPLSVYGSLPAFDEVAMSPSGARLALVTTSQDKRILLVLGKDRKPELKTEVGNFKVRNVVWADENHVLVWVSQTSSLGIGFTTNQTELTTVAVVNVDKRTLFSVFAKYKNIVGGVWRYLGVRERDGHLYGYFTGITLQRSSVSGELELNDTKADLYEVDLDSGDARKIATAPDSAYREWLVDRKGGIPAYMDFLADRGNWRIVNSAGKTIASGVQQLGDVDLMGFGRSADSLLYKVRNPSTGKDSWYELPLAGGQATELFAEGGADSVIYDRGTTRLIGFWRDGRQQFLLSRHQSVKELAANAFPKVAVSISSWDDIFDHLLLHTSGNGDAGTWWELDVDSSSATKVVSAYDIPASQIGPVRSVDYKAADGLEMDGVLTLPPGREAKNLPLVMLPHGGPAAHDLPEFDWIPQAFAVRGYAVFQPNFRGSTQKDAAFERAGHGQWGRKMQSDISDGLAELVKQGIVDPARVCIVGASYGGYAALAGVTLQSGLYRCAVSFAGLGDLVAYRVEELRASNGNPTLRRNLDESVGKSETLAEVSPINFVSKVSAPVLLIHGKDDIVVPYAQSESMARALRKAGKQVELLTLEGEDHWLSRSKTRLQMLEAAVGFVEKQNPAN